MKRFIAKDILFIYLNFKKEDWETLKKLVIPFIKPAWFMKSILVWISSIVFFPIFYLGMIIDDKIRKLTN